jgi:RNA polymerase sigma-70 factor (ECF subfamily)
MRELHLRTDRSAPLTTSGEGTPDALLIQRIAAGNRLAMQVLYLRHHLRVYRHIARIVSDHAATEDLLSDTFLDVWRKADSFRGQASVATWLLTIARNKAISALRRHSPEELDKERTAVLADEMDGPELRLQKKQEFSVLRNSLAQLAPKHREIIGLVYYQDKSCEEAAAILGTPRNTVKTRMFYARRRLAELLTAAGVSRAAS